jgi:hypothetical protein
MDVLYVVHSQTSQRWDAVCWRLFDHLVPRPIVATVHLVPSAVTEGRDAKRCGSIRVQLSSQLVVHILVDSLWSTVSGWPALEKGKQIDVQAEVR